MPFALQLAVMEYLLNETVKELLGLKKGHFIIKIDKLVLNQMGHTKWRGSEIEFQSPQIYRINKKDGEEGEKEP